MSALPQYPPPPLPQCHRRWRRTVGWIGLALAALVVVLIGAIMAALHTRAVQARLLAFGEARASTAVGLPVRAEGFNIGYSLWNPKLTLYGITVGGAAPYVSPPLLTVSRLTVGIQVTSLRHLLGGGWYIDLVDAEQPTVYLYFDRNGRSNLPPAPGTSGESGANLFGLGIRQARLRNGTLTINQRQFRLAADLQRLWLQSSYNAARQQYRGGLGYGQGTIVIPGYPSLPHSFTTQFMASPSGISWREATLRGPPGSIVASGWLDDYSQPRLQSSYHAALELGALGQWSGEKQMPAGVAQLSGTVNYNSAAPGGIWRQLDVDGTASAARLSASNSASHAAPRLVVSDAAARYQLAGGNLDLTAVQAHTLGGTITAEAHVTDLDRAATGSATARVHGISLRALQALRPNTGGLPIRVQGAANAEARARWHGAFAGLSANGSASVNGTVADRGRTAPVKASVNAAYIAAYNGASLALRPLQVDLPGLVLHASGTVAVQSQLGFDVEVSDLAQVEDVATLFSPAASGWGLAGSGNATGTVQGTVSAPTVAANVVLANFQVHHVPLTRVAAEVRAGPEGIVIQGGDVLTPEGGSVTVNASLALNAWKYRSADPFTVNLRAQRLDVAALERAAGVSAPMIGQLTANLAVHGSVLAPSGSGTLTLTHALLGTGANAEPASAVSANLSGDGTSIRAQIVATTPAGTLRAAGTFDPRARSYDARLEGTGIKLEGIRAIATRNATVRGTVNLAANGTGTLDNPGAHVTVSLPRLTVAGQQLQGVVAHADIANHVATIGLDSQAVNTPIHGQATVQLTGAFQTTAQFDTQPFELGPLAALYAPSLAGSVGGATEVHVSLRGPLREPARLEAAVNIPRLTLDYAGRVHLAAVAPIRIGYQNGVATLAPTGVVGTDTSIQVQGSYPVEGGGAPTLQARGTVDLKLAQLFDPDINSSGQLQLNVHAAGGTQGIAGDIRVVDAALNSPTLPLALTGGQADLTLDNNRLQIAHLAATVGGGQLTAQGAVTYLPNVRFNLAATANNIRLLYPQDMREELGANLSLTGTLEAAALRGQVRIEQMSVTPGFDITSLLGDESLGAGTVPAPGSFSQNLALNVGVVSTGDLKLTSRTFSMQGSANLQVRGTAAEPVILGRLNVDSGDLIFLGNRYILDPGTLDFANPAETVPTVNLSASTTIQSYDIHLRLQGTTDQLHTAYSSDPSLPQTDIINLLAFGQTTESSAANPTPGNLGAENLIASQLSGQVTNRLQQLAGLSQLSVDPVLGGTAGQNPGARITVQQRVASNLFVTLSTDVTGTSPQQDVVQIQYQMTPRFGITATRDQNGGFDITTRIKKSW